MHCVCIAWMDFSLLDCSHHKIFQTKFDNCASSRCQTAQERHHRDVQYPYWARPRQSPHPATRCGCRAARKANSCSFQAKFHNCASAAKLSRKDTTGISSVLIEQEDQVSHLTIQLGVTREANSCNSGGNSQTWRHKDWALILEKRPQPQTLLALPVTSHKNATWLYCSMS